MISAERFARQSSLWRTFAPSLDQYVRWANKNLNRIGPPLYGTTRAHRHALIAETAFNAVARRADAVETEDEERARLTTSILPSPEAESRPLDMHELSDADAIRWRLEAALSSERRRAFKARPEFPGCGIVDPAVGDFLAGGELIEVKSVERQLRGVDFRQILVYSALAYAANQSIERLTLINPRYGFSFSTPSADLALDLGSGSWSMLMQNLRDAMSGPVLSQ
jgi:hypothetical protein